jgi:hypothetical protein
VTATAWEAAERFSRAVSVAGATESDRILIALGEVNHADTAAATWFIMSELQGLVDRTMLTVQAELVRGWGVPAAVAVSVYPELQTIAVQAASAIVPPTVAAAAAGEDPQLICFRAVTGMGPAVQAAAETVFAAAGLAGGADRT